MAEYVGQTAGAYQVFHVAPVARPFGHDHRARAFALTQFDDGGHYARIGLELVPAQLADCADVLSLDGAAVVSVTDDPSA